MWLASRNPCVVIRVQISVLRKIFSLTFDNASTSRYTRNSARSALFSRSVSSANATSSRSSKTQHWNCASDNPAFARSKRRSTDVSSGSEACRPGSIVKGFTDVIVRDKPAGLIRVWDPHLRPQFTQQYNLTLEYQLYKETSLSV